MLTASLSYALSLFADRFGYLAYIVNMPAQLHHEQRISFSISLHIWHYTRAYEHMPLTSAILLHAFSNIFVCHPCVLSDATEPPETEKVKLLQVSAPNLATPV